MFFVLLQAQSQLQFNWTDLALFSFFRLVSSSRLVNRNSIKTQQPLGGFATNLKLNLIGSFLDVIYEIRNR